MPGFLRQSTSQVIRFGPFLDSTDGVTAETGLTIAQADMQISKDGGAFAQKNASGNATHDADGWYSTTLNTTDTATVGITKFQVAVAGALPVWEEFYVVEEAVYDSLYAASASGSSFTDESKIATGTAQAVTSTTIRLASGETFADDELIGATVVVTGGTLGIGQSRSITDYVSSTDTATVDTWTTTPTGTTTYAVYATPPSSTTNPVNANVIQVSGDAGAADNLELDYDGTGYTKSNSTIGTATTVTGGATSAALATVDTNVDAILVDTGTTLPASLSTIDTNVDTIQAKTDDLTFTKDNELDTNTQSINGAAVTGDGNATPWDGA